MSAPLRGAMQDFGLTLTHVLRRMRTVHHRSEVVTQLDASGRRARATFAQTADRADRLGAGLRALGIEPGDRVGTFAWNTQEQLEAYHAVPGIGAVLHTMNLRLSPEQVAFTANHAGDRVVIVDDSLVAEMERIAPLLQSVERFVVIGDGDAGALGEVVRYEDLLAAHEPGLRWPELDERSAAALCYTSGTTGDPKGVLYSHRSLCLHALIMSGHDVYRVSERDRILSVVPMFHAMGWNLAYLSGLIGAGLVMPGRFLQSEHLARLIAEEQVTASCGVPTIWMDLLRYADRHDTDLSSLEIAICGGTQVPPVLMSADELREFLAARVAKWWLPDAFAFLDEIPRTSVGKLDKRALRGMLAAGELRGLN